MSLLKKPHFEVPTLDLHVLVKAALGGAYTTDQEEIARKYEQLLITQALDNDPYMQYLIKEFPSYTVGYFDEFDDGISYRLDPKGNTSHAANSIFFDHSASTNSWSVTDIDDGALFKTTFPTLGPAVQALKQHMLMQVIGG